MRVGRCVLWFVWLGDGKRNNIVGLRLAGTVLCRVRAISRDNMLSLSRNVITKHTLTLLQIF